MDFQDRSWSCYPQGLSASRRTFLKAIALVAAASGFTPPRLFAQDSDDPPPDFPVGGFPPGSVQLNFNENPLGPSPKAIRAILEDGLSRSNRYNHIDPLIEAIARHHAVSSNNVLIGCGSTEFLQFVPWALLKDGGNVVLPVPTYGWCGGVAESMGREAIRVPLVDEGRVDVRGIERAVTADSRMIYVANPNNPTGAALDGDELASLLKALPRGSVLFVDEAYHDFLPEGASAIDRANRGAPVLVARTFSKAFGLAGLRLGYVIGPEEIIERVKSVWWGDLGINTAAHRAGPAALADTDHVARYVRTIDEGLAQLRSGLERHGLHPYGHRAPFFMVDLGRRARPIVAALYEKNIFVKDGSTWGMPTFLRISVGRAEDNESFLRALDESLKRVV